MDYIKFANCRVCQLQADHKVISDLNFKLLEGVPFEQIVGEYSQYFTNPNLPLNYFAVKRHKAHLNKQVGTNLLGIPSAPSGEFNKSDIVISDDKTDLGLGSYIDFIKANKEKLDGLVISAQEDLEKSDEFLGAAQTPKTQALILGVRDNIRNSIADITERIHTLLTPSLNNINSKNNAQVTELLLIVKKSAVLSIKDKEVRDSFLKELALQIASSRELKWLSEE